MSLDQQSLEQARAWITRETGANPRLSEISTVETSLTERSGTSLSWILDGPDFMAQLVLWDGGEFEQDLIEVATGHVQTRSGKAESRSELDSLLETARDWARHGPKSA